MEELWRRSIGSYRGESGRWKTYLETRPFAREKEEAAARNRNTTLHCLQPRKEKKKKKMVKGEAEKKRRKGDGENYEKRERERKTSSVGFLLLVDVDLFERKKKYLNIMLERRKREMRTRDWRPEMDGTVLLIGNPVEPEESLVDILRFLRLNNWHPDKNPDSGVP